MSVTCPHCKEYEGSGSEVQAHIMSKKDSDHKGKTGSRVLEMQSGGRGDRGQAGSGNGKKAGPGDGNGGKSGSGSAGDQPRGGRAAGRTGDVPEVKCQNCGRRVKYPELMPYKASCPGCDSQIRAREAFERLEKKADEKGKNELAESYELSDR